MNLSRITKVAAGICVMTLVVVSFAASAASAKPEDKGNKGNGNNGNGNSQKVKVSSPSTNTSDTSTNSDSSKGKSVKKNVVVTTSNGTSTSTTTPLQCPKRGFGHLIAFGWLKKNNPIVVPEGCPLPGGIAAKLGRIIRPGSGDKTAPVISNVSVSVATSTASVTWATNEQSDSKVFYSTTNPVDINSASTPSAQNSSLVSNHSLSLSGLTPSTTYYAVVRSADSAGNVATSTQVSFTTSSVQTTDNTAPVISSVSVVAGTSTINVNWNTDELATSRVFYSTSSPIDVGSSTTARVENMTLKSAHSLSITGLAASTTHYIVIESRDALNNVTLTATIQVVTNQQDTAAPVISSVVSVVGSSSIQVSWLTDEPATSRLFYATTTPVDINTASHVDSTSLITNHFLNITGLATSTTYYVTVVSEDAVGNKQTYTGLPSLTTGI